MKALILGIVIVAATIQSTTAQRERENNTKYGFALSEFKTGSGFQAGYECHFTVQPSAKAKVGFGMFLDNESKKISGVTVTHQRMLMTKRRNLPVLQPFIFYNFIYRKTTIPELVEKPEPANYIGLATYTSLEHHLGMGLNINISKNIIIDLGAGYGLYLGSIKRPSAPNPITREISGTNGNTFIFKTGIGFGF
jgi:hypothetical protein